MTEDVKATRLSKAAREFNVGISTIVEFLHKKGFVLDPNPNTKVPHEAYLLLVKEYSTDISAKKESEKLILRDLHRKKESVSIDDFSAKNQPEESEKEEEILIKDSSGLKQGVEIKPEIKKPDIKLVGKIDLEKTLKPKTEKPVTPKAEPEKSLPGKFRAQKSCVTDEEEKSKAGIDIHIVGKIDLEPAAKEAQPPEKEVPKKRQKKVKEPDQPVEKEPVEKKVQEKVEEPISQLVEEEIALEEIDDSLLEPEELVELFRPDIKKLSGPTVIGKIDLPVEEKKKATPYQPVKVDGEPDYRRKKRRKRITRRKSRFLFPNPILSRKRKNWVRSL